MQAKAPGGNPPSDRLWLAAVFLIALAIRLPNLNAPLLEGAAGKQTHTAMVARNLYRGRSSWLRPMVDDIGPPGYFVKELPVVPLLAAAVYHLTGGPHDVVGRAISVLAWCAGIPLLAALVRPDRGSREAVLAALWFALAPLGIVYSRAFMTDAAMVSASLAALVAAFAWRAEPRPSRAAAAGAALGAALLLKPHAVFWLAPALAVALRDRPSAGRASSARTLVPLILCLSIGVATAAAWYAHAAAIHRLFPVPGAMVAEGWVDPQLWLEPSLYARAGAQLLHMVLTPAGTALAVFGLWGTGGLGRRETALLLWGGGVVLQILVLGTRLLDQAARSSEYYQLAAVPTAALLIARGGDRLARLLTARRAALRPLALTAIFALLAAGALVEARPALAIPERYAGLLDDCALVRSLSRPDEELLVIADRGGTVLYYCDRRGAVFTPATSLVKGSAATRKAAGPEVLGQALERASWVMLPFPEDTPRELVDYLERDWERVATPGRAMALYVRPEARGRHKTPAGGP